MKIKIIYEHARIMPILSFEVNMVCTGVCVTQVINGFTL